MASESAYEVEFVQDDEKTVTVTPQEDETLLEAARREDVDLRWGCTEGECTSCTSRLLEGEIEWVSPPKVITEDKREDDYISLCITRPASDCRIRVGDSILLDTFPSVWRNLESNDD